MKEINYNVVQGDSFLLSLTYTDSSGSAVNLTGASAYMEIRDMPGGRVLSATASGRASASVNDGISFTASAGKIDINITPAKTSLFNYPRSAYQLQLTTSGGTKTTLLTGWFIVNAGVIDS
jgi:hypothetical protein